MTKEFTQPGKASIIIDGQFGSTGKGLIAAYLAERNHCDWATTNASANAGHTTVLADGRKFVTYHLPTFGVMQKCGIFLNAGAIIDPELLIREVQDLGVEPGRVVIHPHAAVIAPEDKAYEKSETSGTTKSGSTRKGVGRALARKIMREGLIAAYCDDLHRRFTVEALPLAEFLDRGKSQIVVEIPQGFSLGINHGLSWPHCTSRDVTAMQGLADAGIHPHFLGKVMMSCRTFPIRVGHIFDEQGRKIGDSGPVYEDQRELSWESDFPGVAPEITTVTKRVRRIFSWSQRQYELAVRFNRPDFVFLNFCNYLKSAEEFKTLLGLADVTARVTHYGVGPSVKDVVESWSDVMGRMGWAMPKAS